MEKRLQCLIFLGETLPLVHPAVEDVAFELVLPVVLSGAPIYWTFVWPVLWEMPQEVIGSIADG